MSGSGSGRKRSSKWDLKDQPQFEDENAQDDGWHGKAGRPFYPRESGHGWSSPELVGNNGSKWSALETNDLRSKNDLVFPSREPRGSHKNDNIDKDNDRYVEDSMAWDADGNYGTRMSPGLHEWRHQNPSQSPKSGWSRSLRDRSRSRSRSKSRGRSRSPVRGLRREPGFPDRSRGRSGVSSQLCKDFAAGRCRRGNHCMFLHEGNEDYDDYWDSRHRKGGSSKYSSLDTRDYSLRSGRSSVPCNDFVKGRCRRGASCRFDHHDVSDGFSKGYPNEFSSREKENNRRQRDNSTERGVEHEFRRTSDIPCKFFAAGNCRNGRHCRFYHHSQVYGSPDRESQDKWALSRKSDDMNQPFDGPKWNDTVTLPDAAKLSEDVKRNIGAPDPSSTAWSVNDRLRNSVNNESITNADPTISCVGPKNNDKEALQWKTDNAGVCMGRLESRHPEKWLDDMDMSPDWNYTVPSSNRTVKEEHGRISPHSESFNDTSLITCKPNVNQEATGQINGAAVVAHQVMVEKSFFPPKHDLRNDTATALPYDDNIALRKAVSSRADLNVPASITPTQSFDQNVQHVSVFPFPSLHTTGQSQTVIPTVPHGGILKRPQNNTPSNTEAKPVAKPEFLDANTSAVNSGIPPSQSIVSGEQLANLTNLSASLVQLLGNGQQLPQLYAALSSNNSTSTHSFANSEGPVFPVSTSTVQLDPVPHTHYDPTQDGTETKRPEISNNPSGVLPNTTMNASVLDGRSETQLGNLNPPSLSGALDATDCKQADDLVEEPKNKRLSSTTLEPTANSNVSKGKKELGSGESKKAQEENRNTQESDPLDGVDKEAANDSKKNKDAKGIRAFKFALVEFVKELLKPTWKEGQIDKDAYKNIVKKVVDKVTGTMQGANVPQTQEKIDNYLSFSKAKLTKLVQAYVEKTQKG